MFRVTLLCFSILLISVVPFATSQAGQHHPALKAFFDKAESGRADAQYNLGLIYEEGTGVDKSIHQAIHWYSLAAQQGYVRAQYKLGYLYYFGPSTIRDPKQAMQWLHRAADQNDINAIYRLGTIHSDSENPGQNRPLAISYLEDAARDGHNGAQFLLGQLLQQTGPEQDILKALIWLEIAVKGSNREAIPLLHTTRNQLTTEQQNLADQAATEIYSSIYPDKIGGGEYYNNRDIGISNAILITTNWLNNHDIRLQPHQLPEIKLVDKRELVRTALQIESRKGGKADEITILASYRSYDNVPLRALYDGRNRMVLMPDDWQYSSVTGQAELIHELVHHHQVITGAAERIACTGTLEKQAMRIQNQWLKAHSLPVAFSETDIVLMGDCDE